MRGIALAVHVGAIRPLGPRKVPSGFVKHPVEGDVALGMLGFAGDAQADLKNHGGIDKAVYAYAAQHYSTWISDFPQHEPLLIPGGFGENLPVSTLDESQVCLGDIFNIGDATLQVSQPRQPCFKLGLYFGNPMMVKAMVKNYRSGWYMRVLKPGTVRAGSEITLADRPLPDWPIRRLNRLSALKSATVSEIDTLARQPLLSDGWRGAVGGLKQATAAVRRL